MEILFRLLALEYFFLISIKWILENFQEPLNDLGSNENSLTLPSILAPYLLSDKGARINLSGKHNEQHDLEFHVSNFITVNRPFNDLSRAETTRREAWKLHAQKNLRKFSTS